MNAAQSRSREATLKVAAQAATLLYRAGANRVWICGSLAHGVHWDDASDVDFATIGLPPTRRDILATELGLRVGRHVDIILLEDSPAWLRAQSSAELLPLSADGRIVSTPAPTPFPVARLNGHCYPKRLHEQRHALSADILIRNGARQILDIGCGSGEFAVAALQRWPESTTTIHGIDPDPEAVSTAVEYVQAELPEDLWPRTQFELAGVSDLPGIGRDHDAVVAVEVIEHLRPSVLASFAEQVFDVLRPAMVVLTTPNAEFNVLFPRSATSPAGELRRHPDHQFEWTREEMRVWLRATAGEAGYRAQLRGVGEAHPDYGSPTQLWTLTKRR